MAAQIRQEINILDHLFSSGTGFSLSNERSYVDTTQYNGTVTAYFEIVANNTNPTTASNVQLEEVVSRDTMATQSVPANTGYTLYRTSSFTLKSGGFAYNVNVNGTAIAAQVNVKSARIVIIQNDTTLTNTETQIEIGNYNLTRTAEAATILTNPKYWLYTAANWDGTKTFYAEAVYDSGDMDTITVAIYTSASITAPSWSSAATIVSAATTTVPTRTRVAFTPVDGQWYTIFSLNGSMDNHDIYNAKVIVQQSDFDLKYIDLFVYKDNTPTDNMTIEVRDTSITGTILGTSDAVAISSFPAGFGSAAYIRFTFATPISLSPSTKYYFNVKRSGASDNINRGVWVYSSGSVYSGGGDYIKNSGTWGAESSTTDYKFKLFDENTVERITQDGSSGGARAIVGATASNEEQGQSFTTLASSLTTLEPQYLLANTLFAAGTSLQTFLTDWDSTEWDDGAGSIAYYFQAEAANGSTSDVTLNQADGGGVVTNSTLTNIDNAQISAAMTMPGDENLDVTATTNAGDVAAARMLVAYTFAAAAESTSAPTNYQNLIITS